MILTASQKRHYYGKIGLELMQLMLLIVQNKRYLLGVSAWNTAWNFSLQFRRTAWLRNLLDNFRREKTVIYREMVTWPKSECSLWCQIFLTSNFKVLPWLKFYRRIMSCTNIFVQVSLSFQHSSPHKNRNFT